MPRPRYYSPRIERDLIRRLYFAAKAEGVPMTTLASRLVRRGLDSCEKDSSVVSEDPPEFPVDAPRATDS